MASNSPKQPPPRTLSPDVPVTSYPTPNTSDLLVVQDVDTRLPGYSPANYGDPHPDYTLYPNLKLVYQTPLDNENNYMWVRRVYANERFNQEAYNYALKYSGEDPTKPIYVRTYTLPRATYAPVSKGTPDSVYAAAVLVEESVDRIKDDQTDGQLDSLFVKVTRVYETLPGPGLTTLKKGSASAIPTKFQAARQVTVTKTTVAANSIPDDTTSTIVESSVEQASIAKAQKVNSTLDTNIVSLGGSKITSQQQVATVTETMVPTGSGQDRVIADALTVEGNVENLGNGQSVVTKVSVPSVFPETRLVAERPDVVPQKFRVAIPTVTNSGIEVGTATQPTLSTGDLSKSEEQVTQYKKRKTSVSRTITPQKTLVGYKVTPQQQLGTVTESYDPTGGQAIVVDALTVEGSIEAVGDGSTVLTQVQAPTLFTEQAYTSEKPLWGLPMKFKVADPPVKESHVQAGTVTSSDVAFKQSYEMDRSSEQVTSLKKKTSVSSMSGKDVVLNGSQTGMWGQETVSESLLNQGGSGTSGTWPPAATGGYLTAKDEVEPTGDGRYVRKTTKYPSKPATLREVHVDEMYKVKVYVDKTLVDPTTPNLIPATIQTNESYELHPIDPYNSILMHSFVDQSSLPSQETWSHTVHFSFPDELIEAGVYYESSTGKGGAAGSGTGDGNVIWTAQAESSAKAIIRGVPYTKFNAGYSGPCSATTTRTFYLSPPTGTSAVTPILPVIGSIVITGVGGSSKETSYVRGKGETETESGGSYAVDVDVVAVRHNIGPCVHSSVSLTEIGESDTGLIENTATGGSVPGNNSYPAAYAKAEGTAKATLVLPDSSAPIQSGGTLISEIRTEKWRFGVWIQEVTTITRP
jgi:hypothetical protein